MALDAMLGSARLVTAAATFCLACAPAPARPSFTGNNNSAVLTGPSIGTGAAMLFELRKALSVTVAGPSAVLPVGRAFALRFNSRSESAWIVVEVRNTGTMARCFITAGGLELRDGAGAVVGSESTTFVQGSVGQLGRIDQPIFTDTCLAPGEAGLLMTSFSAATGELLFSRAEALVFRWENASGNVPFMPAPKLTPTGYTVTSTGAINVAFTNDGTGAALMTSSKYVLLDGEGLPLFWGFLTSQTTPADGLIAAGGQGSVEGTHAYTGTAGSLRPFLDFNPPPTTALLGAPRERPLTDAERLAEWTAEQLRRRAQADEQ
ncbi:MAG: hypothetical protein Q8S33_17195 [Myxococcales bacterium]|nr:hypothetical protein [Myxococcales bacterium]